MTREPRISLVSMPWAAVDAPSIQIGVLTRVLRRAGFNVTPHSLFVDAASFFAERPAHTRVDIDDYERIANRWWTVGLGDWIFRVPPLCEPSQERDERYRELLASRGVPDEIVEAAERMRAAARDFLEHCVDEVMAARPAVVGFSTTFAQNVASLAMAAMLKRREPGLAIVFGGSNCDGPMGAALHRLFPWIDFVVRGEGEHTFPALCREVISGAAITPRPGLCFRSDGRSIATAPESGGMTAAEDLCAPDYDEYFDRLRRSRWGRMILARVRVPVETARGCWWGEKHHCTFCGLNGMSMKFRSKPAHQAFREIIGLASRHGRLDFEVVDNIMDSSYVRSLVPMLAQARRRGLDVSLFFETKANLRHDQMRALRDAGIVRIQPGIESLSTPILRMMRKGVTALQNVRLLKWAARYGIQVTWNIIYGFPGEPPEEYGRMAEMARSLFHLKPPAMVALQVQRFSPYHEEPSRFGISIDGPAPHYRHLYDVSARDLLELAYNFSFSYADGRDPESYVAALRAVVGEWDAAFARTGNRALRYYRGPNFIRIRDLRFSGRERALFLAEAEAAVYLACEEGATAREIRQSLADGAARDLSEAEIARFLDGLVEERLVYFEDGKYLSLAIPANAEAEIRPPRTASPGSAPA